jgi:hypothetical protein
MSDALMGMIGTGLSLFGGIEGLLGASNAEHQAEVAAQNAIRDFKGASSQENLQMLTNGTAGLNTLSGGLGNALQNTGRNLGAALAGAGVYNSTGAAGALANQAAANAGAESRYSSGLANELLQQQNQTNQQAAQMSYGLAVNNLNYSRQQQSGAENGLSSLFGNLGQMNFGNLFGKTGGAANTSGSVLNMNGVLPPTNGVVQPVQNQYTGGGLGGAGGGSF